MSYKKLGQDNIRKDRMTTTALLLLLVFTTQIPSASAGLPRSIRRAELTIDLGDGVETDAQITYPAIGDGPFPVVLLVPGGGLTDMDEYIPAGATTTGEPAGPFREIAEHLSKRGFMVLRYDKRGVTRNATMADYPLYAEATVDTFKEDAEAALAKLKENPMADISDITVIGHSESSIIVPRMAEDDPTITKVVILGASARDYISIKYTKVVDLRIEFAESALDLDGDGLVTVEEAVTGFEPYGNSILPRGSMLMGEANETQWNPAWDPNGDGSMNITGEFKPVLERVHSVILNPEYAGYNQTQAHVSMGATMDMIGDLGASILILQGEGDYQTPLIEALLLEQALEDSGHPDHTLYTYPGLSHFFHPTDGWEAGMGPMEPYVLKDLYQWLISPERGLDQITGKTEFIKEMISGIEDEVEANLVSLNTTLTGKITEIEENLPHEHEKTSDSSMIPFFTVILVLVIVTVRKNRLL
jgi:pimeloyl-ACP methyl ester carboxylesterase